MVKDENQKGGIKNLVRIITEAVEHNGQDTYEEPLFFTARLTGNDEVFSDLKKSIADFDFPPHVKNTSRAKSIRGAVDNFHQEAHVLYRKKFPAASTLESELAFKAYVDKTLKMKH